MTNGNADGRPELRWAAIDLSRGAGKLSPRRRQAGTGKTM
jgi:hypothetical protein